MTTPILEVIACSVSDAIAAHQGGAGRLEIVRDLDRGGLTPSIALVRDIKEAVQLPLRVMVRESDGYGTLGEREVQALCDAAREFSRLAVDGLVMGFIKGGRVDLELTARIVSCAPGLKTTFHHAFEDAVDQLQAVNELKKLPQVDRILSSGGSGQLEVRKERLTAYVQAADPEITIIAGGGIDIEAITLLKRITTIREFHVGRAAREGFQVAGAVQAELVHTLVRATRDI